MSFPTRALAIYCTLAEKYGWYRSRLDMVFKIADDLSVACEIEACLHLYPLCFAVMVRMHRVRTERQSSHGR